MAKESTAKSPRDVGDIMDDVGLDIEGDADGGPPIDTPPSAPPKKEVGKLTPVKDDETPPDMPPSDDKKDEEPAPAKANIAGTPTPGPVATPVKEESAEGADPAGDADPEGDSEVETEEPVDPKRVAAKEAFEQYLPKAVKPKWEALSDEQKDIMFDVGSAFKKGVDMKNHELNEERKQIEGFGEEIKKHAAIIGNNPPSEVFGALLDTVVRARTDPFGYLVWAMGEVGVNIEQLNEKIGYAPAAPATAPATGETPAAGAPTGESAPDGPPPGIDPELWEKATATGDFDDENDLARARVIRQMGSLLSKKGEVSPEVAELKESMKNLENERRVNRSAQLWNEFTDGIKQEGRENLLTNGVIARITDQVRFHQNSGRAVDKTKLGEIFEEVVWLDPESRAVLLKGTTEMDPKPKPAGRVSVKPGPMSPVAGTRQTPPDSDDPGSRKITPDDELLEQHIYNPA